MRANILRVGCLMVVAIFFNCKNEKSEPTKTESTLVERKVEFPTNVLDVVTRSMEFTSVDTVPSGWNTFRYDNRSNETHFILLDKYPEGKTHENALSEIFPVFDEGMQLINEGKPEEGFAAFDKLPEWFSQIVYYGGSGLIASQHTSLTTVKLDPGYYVMECYVKMPNGRFHASMGMTKPLIVTEEDSGNTAPEPTVNITLSGVDGISYDKPITRGKQILSVYVKDQKAHENFVWHDINLVKLADYADENALEKWMDWSNPKGLITPVPSGMTFLGGVNDMKEGSTGYFMVDLQPGKYALISEVPNAKSKNLFKVFEVTP